MLELYTAPTVKPLTITEVQNHLRLDSSNYYPAPITAPSVAMAGAGVGNVDNGIHRYRVTFVTADGETDGGVISSPINVLNKTTNGKVALTNIPLGGSQVTSRKIYRTAAGGSSYLLLATIADNTTTTYTDNIADSSLGAGIPTSNATADPYLTGLIDTAVSIAESHCKRALINQTWLYKFDKFPCDNKIYLPLAGLNQVNSIQYYDSDNVLQTLDAATYEVQNGEVGIIQCAYDEYWPIVKERLNAVTVNFRAGYGATASDVPAPIKQAMLLMIGHWYNTRESVNISTIATEIPMTSKFLLNPHRAVEFFNKF